MDVKTGMFSLGSLFGWATLMGVLIGCGRSEGPQRHVPVTVRTIQSSLSFDHVRPILQSRCTPCHNFGNQYGAIYPLARDGENSLVYRYVIDKKPREMPPPNSPQGRSITAQEREQLAQWAMAGAPQESNGAEPPPAPLEPTLSPQAQMLRQCWSCHGEDGRASLAMRPHLAGQPQAYLKNQLQLFRGGERMDHTENQMNKVAQNLTDSDIDFLSNYFSFFKGPEASTATTLSIDQIRQAETLYRLQSCHSCHGPSSGLAAGRLEGQNETYLIQQLLAFRQSKRKSIAMEMVARDLSENEISLLAAWLAQGSPKRP